MATVLPGRYTAEIDGDVVVFLIGMRINKPWKVWAWLPVFTAMPRLVASQPEGLLGARTLLGPNPMMIQYWRSFEHLERFARAPEAAHLPAWRRFNRAVGASGDVGIWHETYLIRPGALESVYVNMPVTGLAAATSHVPVISNAARSRLAA